MEDLDIWRTASAMISKHGDEAELRAAMQSDHLAHKGDEAGKRVWLLVMDAIKKLSETKPGGVIH